MDKLSTLVAEILYLLDFRRVHITGVAMKWQLFEELRQTYPDRFIICRDESPLMMIIDNDQRRQLINVEYRYDGDRDYDIKVCVHSGENNLG